MALLLKDYIIASGNFSLKLDTGNLPLPFRPLTAIRLACKGAFWSCYLKYHWQLLMEKVIEIPGSVVC